MGRIEAGYSLYKQGNVTLVLEYHDEIQFEVKSGDIIYLVSIYADIIRCNCIDFDKRYKSVSNAENGSFLCKHCFAALFKLSELKMAKSIKLPSKTVANAVV